MRLIWERGPITSGEAYNVYYGPFFAQLLQKTGAFARAMESARQAEILKITGERLVQDLESGVEGPQIPYDPTRLYSPSRRFFDSINAAGMGEGFQKGFREGLAMSEGLVNGMRRPKTLGEIFKELAISLWGDTVFHFHMMRESVVVFWHDLQDWRASRNA